MYPNQAFWKAEPVPGSTNTVLEDEHLFPGPLTFDRSPIPKASHPPRRKNAIVTAVWGSRYASLALMLGQSIKMHNDLDQINAELVILTLEREEGWTDGLTSENMTVLEEQGGWRIRSRPRLEVPGVDMDKIQPHRRLNLNKLQMFGWSEYERIMFIDADCFVKGSIEEIFKLPPEIEFAAAADGWPSVEVDPRFNSGFMFFTPSKVLLEDTISRLADPQYHDPTEGDQQFLQNYWKFRDYRLPSKFNLNLTHFVWRRAQLWDRVWPDARVIHFTERKPHERWWPGGWCQNPVANISNIGPDECAHVEVLQVVQATSMVIKT